MGQVASISVLSSIPLGGATARTPSPGRAPLWELVGAGSMVELTGTAPGKLSTLARLVARAQAQGEVVAWVGPREGASFYPPDFARVGIDLASLVVVRVPTRAAEGPVPAPGPVAAPRAPKPSVSGAHGIVRATEVLLRSGAFGLVVVDLSQEVPRGEMAWQSRLSGLVRMHEARLVLVTSSRPDEPSLGPLVSLRLVPEVVQQGGRAVLAHRLLKSKLGHQGEPSPDVRALPEGLV